MGIFNERGVVYWRSQTVSELAKWLSDVCFSFGTFNWHCRRDKDARESNKCPISSRCHHCKHLHQTARKIKLFQTTTWSCPMHKSRTQMNGSCDIISGIVNKQEYCHVSQSKLNRENDSFQLSILGCLRTIPTTDGIYLGCPAGSCNFVSLYSKLHEKLIWLIINNIHERIAKYRNIIMYKQRAGITYKN